MKILRNFLLLFIAAIGLYAFEGSKEERNAFILKSIEDKVTGSGMKMNDIKLLQVRDISEQTYAEYVVDGGIEMIAGKGTWSPARYTREELAANDKAFEEKLYKLSDEKGYGYYVRIKCYLDGDGFPPGKRTMQFVVSRQAGTDLAMKGGWGSR